jgi:hypothetical protein
MPCYLGSIEKGGHKVIKKVSQARFMQICQTPILPLKFNFSIHFSIVFKMALEIVKYFFA